VPGLAVALALSVVSVGFAGCGDDDEAADPGGLSTSSAPTTPAPSPEESSPDFSLTLEAGQASGEHPVEMTAGEAAIFEMALTPPPAEGDDPDLYAFGMAADARTYASLLALVADHYDVVEGGADPAEVIASLDESQSYELGPMGSGGGALGFTAGCFVWVAAVDGTYLFTVNRDIVDAPVVVDVTIAETTYDRFDPEDPFNSIDDYNPATDESAPWAPCIFLP